MYIRRFTLFSTIHPSLLLFYALGAPVLAMIGNNPVVQCVCILCAIIVYSFFLGWRATLEGMKGISFVIFFVTGFNWMTNAMGTTEIFRIGSKLFTVESLCYGLSNGVMLGTVILWFQMFTAIVPNDKFLYLFGKRFQTAGLLLSMILKLFPETKYKIACIRFAQNTAGDSKESWKQKCRRGMRQISGLLEWSMEDGIETADSMRARGYGERVRGCYEVYCFSGYDVCILVYFLIAFVSSVMTILLQKQSFRYYPVLGWEPGKSIYGMIILVIFLLTPVWLEGVRRRGR